MALSLKEDTQKNVINNAMAVVAPPLNNRGSFIVQEIELHTLAKSCDVMFTHCESIMALLPPGKMGAPAAKVVFEIQKRLFNVMATMGMMFSEVDVMFHRVLAEARAMFNASNNPAFLRHPTLLISQLLASTKNLKDTSEKIQKCHGLLKRIGTYGEQLEEHGSQAGNILVELIMKETNKLGSSKHGEALVQRRTEADAQHEKSRARCMELGNEWTNLRGEESRHATNLVVLKSLADKRKQTADELHAEATRIRNVSTQASEDAANAVDRRWKVKKKCKKDDEGWENNSEQAAQRAAKYAALKKSMEEDFTAASDLSEAATQKHAAVQGQLVAVQGKVAQVAKLLETSANDNVKDKERLDNVVKEIDDYQKQHGGSSLQMIAQFRDTVSKLPAKFATHATTGNSVFSYIAGTLTKVDDQCKSFSVLIDDVKVLVDKATDAKEKTALTDSIRFFLLPSIDRILADCQTDFEKMRSLKDMHGQVNNLQNHERTIKDQNENMKERVKDEDPQEPPAKAQRVADDDEDAPFGRVLAGEPL